MFGGLSFVKLIVEAHQEGNVAYKNVNVDSALAVAANHNQLLIMEYFP